MSDETASPRALNFMKLASQLTPTRLNRLEAWVGYECSPAPEMEAPDPGPGIDWQAMRARIAFAAERLGVPREEAERHVAMSDDLLNENSIAFCVRNGLSVDWIAGRGGKPMVGLGTEGREGVRS